MVNGSREGKRMACQWVEKLQRPWGSKQMVVSTENTAKGAQREYLRTPETQVYLYLVDSVKPTRTQNRHYTYMLKMVGVKEVLSIFHFGN